MAFFKKMKDVFTNDNKDTKESKSVVDISIETSLLALKKYYDIKIKSIDKLAKVDPEWNFFDESVQKDKIEKIKLKIDDKIKERILNNDKINKLNKEIENIEKSYEKNKLQLKGLSNSDNEKEKNALIDKGVEIYKKKQECYEKRKALIKEVDNITKEVKELNFTYIIELSYIEGTYKECERIKKEYNIVNSFTEKALLAIKEYEELNYDMAIKYAKEYFDFFVNKGLIIHNPIVYGLYAKSLVDDGQYEESKKYIDYVLKYYPDSIELHKLIKKVHENLNEIEEANSEEKIINILKN